MVIAITPTVIPYSQLWIQASIVGCFYFQMQLWYTIYISFRNWNKADSQLKCWCNINAYFFFHCLKTFRSILLLWFSYIFMKSTQFLFTLARKLPGMLCTDGWTTATSIAENMQIKSHSKLQEMKCYAKKKIVRFRNFVAALFSIKIVAILLKYEWWKIMLSSA